MSTAIKNAQRWARFGSSNPEDRIIAKLDKEAAKKAAKKK